ncbi:putative bifunctional diguanylate cyclase/phosphodiesterase [Methylobacterium sp. sgz302541]|uniref:putative bifunctional diguanylate cyclase/phosphodiesterase n=1 Tax=unclassified Methylobacterium TaxID=2615210 RepID=UPI003D335931
MLDTTLSRIGGEFLCPYREAAFQADRLPETLRHARLLFALSAILNFVFLASDWRFHGEPHFYVAIPARLMVVAASLACLWLAPRARDFAHLQRIMIGWQAAMTAGIAVLVSSRSDIALFVVLLVPAIFLIVVPTRFRWTLTVGFGSAAVLMGGYMLPLPLPDTSLGLLLAATIEIIALLLVVLRSNRLRRVEWAAVEALRLTNAELAENKRLFETMYRAVPIPIVVSSAQTGRIESMNDAASRFFGIAEPGRHFDLNTSDLTTLSARRLIQAAIEKHGIVRELEIPVTGFDGRSSDVLISAGRVELRGETCVVSSLVDITNRKLAEQAVRRAASHDPLTGLPNRAMFQSTLDGAIVSASIDASSLGLILLDLDAFKEVNDTLGHDAGDALLKEIGRRLSGILGPEDLVARLGGDEFVIVIAGGGRRLGVPRQRIHAMADAVFEVLAPSVSIAGRNVSPRASLGLALYPEHADNAADLLTNADLALYAAKGAGRNQASLFHRSMRVRIEERVALSREFRAALEQGRIVPFYQPKVSFETGRIVGFEALTRWQHPVRGVLAPAAFASVFDDAEVGVLLGLSLARQVAADVAGWIAEGFDPGRVFVNLSTAQFADRELAAVLLGILDDAGLPASRFGVEVTETVLIHGQSERISETLEALRKAGVRVALDDFGTGYASLTHLKRFPVSEIKIDRSFVSDLASDVNDAAIVTALLQLGTSLGLDVTAEGVETREQAAFLTQGGCSYAQGYLYSKPIAASRVPHFLGEHEAALKDPAGALVAAA